MKIAVINEFSACDKNKAIIEALESCDNSANTIINAGMKQTAGEPELTYVDTGFLAALLLNSKRADFVVGGCGTGQGFMIAAMQYPGVFCGLVDNELDAWLFAKINGGNCISLALNKGYGWAGDINLKFIFERFMSTEIGSGYPPHRVEIQQKSRKLLTDISKSTHHDFADIIEKLDKAMVDRVLSFPGVKEILDIDTLEDAALKKVLGLRL